MVERMYVGSRPPLSANPSRAPLTAARLGPFYIVWHARSDSELQSELQTQKQPLYRQLLGRVFNLLLRIILGLRFKDTQCGFKAFSRRSAQVIFPLQQIERWGFDPELLFLARKFGFTVTEVPVAWAHREGTRINPLRDGIRMFGEILKIRWNALSGKYATPAR